MPRPGRQPGASGTGAWAPRTVSGPWSLSHGRARVAAAVLCYVNLLNYMNWFIVAGEVALVDGTLGSTCGRQLTDAPLPPGQYCMPTGPHVLQTVPSCRAALPFSALEGFQPSPNRVRGA